MSAARASARGDPQAPPEDFLVGHASDEVGRTGCTVVIAPPGARGGVDVRGGGPGTRETDVIGPLAGTDQVTAVLLTGGSAFGLAAADGVVRWCEERGRGYPTPAGLVPIVPAAVVYDLAEGDPGSRPGPGHGYAACEAAADGAPQRGRVGAGAATAVGKLLGRERSVPTGIGYAAGATGRGERVAVIAVANAFGDIVAEDGTVLGGPRAEEGQMLRTEDLLAEMKGPPDWTGLAEHNTTLACVMTDAPLDKPGCARIAMMASAGVARAVSPVYSDVDGDVVFCLASGTGRADRFAAVGVGTLAAALTAAAIRDAVEAA